MATSNTTMKGQKPAGKSAAAKLRALLSDPSKILVAPGVYDGLTARIALREGFDCEFFPCITIPLSTLHLNHQIHMYTPTISPL
jgi:hypothetical protein